MSLTIYRCEEDVPQGIEVIKDNDDFFRFSTKLDPENQLHELIVRSIDKGTIISNKTFVGRTKDLGALYKENLSTGTKTLLNVIENSNKCFDTIECGYNVLQLLPHIRNGFIIARSMLIPFLGDMQCDIVLDGKQFNTFKELIKYESDRNA